MQIDISRHWLISGYGFVVTLIWWKDELLFLIPDLFEDGFLPRCQTSLSQSSQLKCFLPFQDRNENKIILPFTHAQYIYKLCTDHCQNLEQELKWEIDLTSSQKYIFSYYFNKNLPRLLWFTPFDCYHERLVRVWSLIIWGSAGLGRTSPRMIPPGGQGGQDRKMSWETWGIETWSKEQVRMGLQMKRRTR